MKEEIECWVTVFVQDEGVVWTVFDFYLHMIEASKRPGVNFFHWVFYSLYAVMFCA